MKATKTWRNMLDKSLSDPNFRKEWEVANAELAELDKIIAARASAGLTQADVAARMGTTPGPTHDGSHFSAENS